MSRKILVTGAIHSGASALQDYLDQYEIFDVLPGEFDLFRVTGGLGDLIEDASHQRSYMYLDLFIKKQREKHSFLSSYKRPSNWIKWVRLQRQISVYKNLVDYQINNHGCISVTAGKRIINQVLSVAGKQGAKVLKHGVFLHLHREIIEEVFDPFKIVVVHRNPDRQIIDALSDDRIVNSILQYSGINSYELVFIDQMYGRRVSDHARRYAQLVINTHRAQIDMYNRIGSDQMMFIKFEDLIFGKDSSIEKLHNFLGIIDDWMGEPFVRSRKRQNADYTLSDLQKKIINLTKPTSDKIESLCV